MPTLAWEWSTKEKGSVKFGIDRVEDGGLVAYLPVRRFRPQRLPSSASSGERGGAASMTAIRKQYVFPPGEYCFKWDNSESRFAGSKSLRYRLCGARAGDAAAVGGNRG